MTVTLREQALGKLRWIEAAGPDGPAVFRALGACMRAEIASFIDSSVTLPALRRHAAAEPGRHRLAVVRTASQVRFPAEWAELSALSDGSGAELDDLALFNLRGDLGEVDYRPAGNKAATDNTGGTAAAAGRAAGDETGCSDLAWRRGSSVIAHNEDGAVIEDGRCALLTLAIEGQPRCTAFWYPVFLPGNAFTVTGDGLVWTIDSLTVAEPGHGAGRHFVGRGLQRSARTVDAAVSYLRDHPSAGGFGYHIGDPAGRVVSVDVAAGQHACAEIGPDGQHGPLAWHTNHPRYLSDPGFPASDNSIQRGELLGALDLPAEEPGASWFLQALAGTPMPDGVRIDPAGPNGGATLCTFVADLTAGEAVLLPRGSDAVAIPLCDLASGQAGRQRTAAAPG